MKRELNELEFLTWTMGQPANAALACRFYGDLSPERVQDALVKIQIRHPLLRTTVFLDETGMPWLTSEGVTPIQPEVIERKGNEHVLRVMEQEMAKPFQEPPLPLMRVIWLRPKDMILEPSEIIICGPHFLGDALSHIFFFRDFFQLLDNPGQEVTPLADAVMQDTILPATIREKIPKTATRFKWWLYFLRFFHLLLSIRPTKKKMVTGFSFKTSSTQLSEKLTSALVSRCKQEHVTVQAALCTAFSSIFTTIYTPVNLRDRLKMPIGEAIGLFATGMNIRMRYNPKQTFWENARKYQEKLTKSLRDNSLFFIYTLLHRAVPLPLIRQFWAMFSDFEETKRLAITNWGVLEKVGMYSAMGNFRVETFFGGVSAKVNSIVIFIHTLNGILHFQPIYNEITTPVPKMEKILNDAIELLTSALV
ncbi:MAG: condensation domain-containing protein [Candidatus Sigynarchaeota archaeon]